MGRKPKSGALSKALIRTYIRQAASAENHVLDTLARLPESGGDCHCEEREIYRYIHEGEWPEIMTVCINCGGSVGQ